jgi:hypothetical protein
MVLALQFERRGRKLRMGFGNLRLWLIAGVLAATAACSPGGEAPSWLSPSSTLIERPRPALVTRVALSLPVEPDDVSVGKERLFTEEAAVPDIAGRWTGVWSGSGAMTRRVSVAHAEFSQSGRWGWGKIVLSDTLAADVPAVVTYRGALGVPVIFDVFPTRVFMKHESGGNYLSAVFRIDGDQLLGMLRGHDTLIVLSRDR